MITFSSCVKTVSWELGPREWRKTCVTKNYLMFFWVAIGKKINFGPKHTFFVIHGRSQMTFMTELEKVIIFRPKHKFFVIHGGPKWTFRCLNWHNSTEGKLKQNSVKVDFPWLQVDALCCICINIICIVSFLRASILSASSTFKLQSASSKFWNIAWH